VSKIIALDTGPLGMIAHSKRNRDVSKWYERLLVSGVQIVIPEICDYELRRELVRKGLRRSLRHLDGLGHTLTYLPITTEAMRRAADLWARMRNEGTPTTDEKALDADVILCAQVQLLSEQSRHELVVATTNVRHLSRMVPARLWSEI
jgi:predicted nucleic acid-binding protein